MRRRRVSRIERQVAEWFETAASRYASLLREGRYNEAVDTLEEVSEAFLSYGFDNSLLQMVTPLGKRLVSAGALSPEKWAWLCNIVGLAYFHRDEIARAKRKFSDMKEIGEKLEDNWIVSTALQNLGICSVQLGKRQEVRELYEHALALKVEIGDKRGVSQIYGNLANLHLEDDEFAEAERLAKASIRIKEEIGDKLGLTASYTTLGIINAKREKFAESEKMFRQVLRLSERAGDPPGVAKGLINIASTCSDQGRYQEAIRHYQAGLAIAYQFTLLREIELAIRGLAVTYYKNKEYQNSIKFFNTNLELTRRPGKEYDHAMVHHDLGTLHALNGKNENANGFYRKAETLFRRLRAWGWVGTTIRERAGLQFRRGSFQAGIRILSDAIKLLSAAGQMTEVIALYDGLIHETLSEGYLDRARKYLERQKAILLDTGEPHGVASKAAIFGAICLDLHLFQEAVRLFSDARNLYRKLRDLQMLGRVLNDMGNVFQEMEDLENAKGLYREALSLAAKTRNRVLEADARNNLGEAERRAGNYGQALSELRRALSLSKLLNDVQGVVIGENNLGLVFESMGRANDAERMFTASLKAARADGNKAGQARALSSLGTLMFQRGRRASALTRYKRAAELAQQSSDKDLEAAMWFNAAIAEARMGREKHASRLAQRAIDMAQERRNYKLAAHICLSSAIENVQNGETYKSGEYLANALIFSFLVSPQYCAGVMGRILILVRDMINTNRDSMAKIMIDSLVRNVRRARSKIVKPFVRAYLLPVRHYLERTEREPFEKFVLTVAHHGVGQMNLPGIRRHPPE